jgi:hypothetical protein
MARGFFGVGIGSRGASVHVFQERRSGQAGKSLALLFIVAGIVAQQFWTGIVFAFLWLQFWCIPGRQPAKHERWVDITIAGIALRLLGWEWRNLLVVLLSYLLLYSARYAKYRKVEGRKVLAGRDIILED